MGDVVSTLVTVVLGVAIFVALLLGLYWVTGKLPERHQERGRVAVFLGPALLLLTIGLAVPALRTIYLSFFRNSGGGLKLDEFVGLDNYREIFSSDATRTVLWNNLLWAIFGTGLSTIIGLFIARLADRMRGEAIAKALIFLPTAISFVGAGIIWKFIYAPDSGTHQIGLLNQFAEWLGFDPQPWLLDAPRNTFLLIVVMIWIQTGFATVVFSAAIKGVPDTLLEAARIDGATEWQVFRRVVVPFIFPTIVTVMTTTTIAVLKVYDIVKAMTNGNFDTNVIGNEIYNKTFVEDRPGYGAALAVILFVVVIPVVLVNLRSQRRARELV